MRQTNARKGILKLLESGGIYSAQEIHDKLPNYDLATIYRNLKVFVEDGLVSELNIDRTQKKYEYKHDSHQHAVCNVCGNIRHVSIDKKKLLDLLDIKDFDVDDIEINIKGKCVN